MRRLQWMSSIVLACGMAVAAHAQTTVEAGPIWDDADAVGKCPWACEQAGRPGWTGVWRTTVPNRMSLCECSDRAAVPAATAAGSVARYDNLDLPKNDLPRSGAPVRTYDECAQRCMAEPACVAFTVNTYTAVCWLKAGVGAPRRSPVAMSGILTGRAPALPGAGSLAGNRNSGGGACNIASTQKCPGCFVSCPPGLTPICNNAVEGVTSTCTRDATCRCM